MLTLRREGIRAAAVRGCITKIQGADSSLHAILQNQNGHLIQNGHLNCLPRILSTATSATPATPLLMEVSGNTLAMILTKE